MPEKKRIIKQIIPAAPGWRAVYKDREVKDSEIFYDPVVCWALVEYTKSKEQEVVGMTEQGGYIDLADEVDDGCGYVPPGVDFLGEKSEPPAP